MTDDSDTARCCQRAVEMDTQAAGLHEDLDEALKDLAYAVGAMERLKLQSTEINEQSTLSESQPSTRDCRKRSRSPSRSDREELSD